VTTYSVAISVPAPIEEELDDGILVVQLAERVDHDGFSKQSLRGQRMMQSGRNATYLRQRTEEEELAQKSLVSHLGLALCPDEVTSIRNGSTICAHNEID
jgi:hypothetical protein